MTRLFFQFLLAIPFIFTFSVAAQDAVNNSNFKQLITRKPDSTSPGAKIWTIKKTDMIRINVVELTGEGTLHKHPDADHSIMVIEGKVRSIVDGKETIMEKGDFVSIPKDVPHKYIILSKKAYIVSMDAPYYDPAKTIQLEKP